MPGPHHDVVIPFVRFLPIPLDLGLDVYELSRHPSENIDTRRRYGMYGRLAIPDQLHMKIAACRAHVGEDGRLRLRVRPGYAYIRWANGFWEYNTPATVWPLYVDGGGRSPYGLSYPVVPRDCLHVVSLRRHLAWVDGELICTQPGTCYLLNVKTQET